MSRTRARRDDYYEDNRRSARDRPQLQKTPYLVLMLFLVIGGVAVCSLAVMLIVGCDRQKEASAPPPNPAPQVSTSPVGTPEEKTIIARSEFKRLVLKKYTQDVLKAVGKPDKTVEVGDPVLKTWYYYGRVRDEVTGRIGNATVRFNINWACDSVDFD
jgi:hypothetical protein